jgi:hypothetical protein
MPLDTTLDEQQPDQRYAHDDKLYVVFYNKPVQNGYKTEQEGRPIFDDVPHVRIHVPGDKTSVVDVPVDDTHKMRFATRWAKFQQGMAQAVEGTPVEQWPLLTAGQAMEFKALNVMTVEQLSGMSDAAAQRFMGGHELRRKAQAFLATAKDSAEAQRLVTANAELTERLATQDRQIQELAAQVAILSQNADRAPSATTMKDRGHGRAGAGTASAG